MSIKTEALIRDLASLFVKYRLSDWAPVLDELERRGGSAGISEAIQRHADEAKPVAPARLRAKKKPAVKRRVAQPKVDQLELQPRFKGPNAETVEKLRDALISKRVLPSLPNLKAVQAVLGIKVTGSNRREALIAILTQYLDGLGGPAFQKALQAIARYEERNAPGAEADYDRWFQLIIAGRRPTH